MRVATPAELVLAGLFGIAIGSFLNVVITRLPGHISLLGPRSRCPRCGCQLAARDNLPLVSFVLLRGRCRTCQLRISFRYPLVEVVTTLLSIGTTARFGVTLNLIAYLVIESGLICLAAIDVEHLLLPRRLVYAPLTTAGVCFFAIALTTGAWGRLLTAMLCGGAWAAVFYLLHALAPRLLGFGDVRLALLLGTGLGWLGTDAVIVGLFLGNAAGLLVIGPLLGLHRLERNTPVPYGPFLATGAIGAIFFTPLLTTWLTIR